MQKITDIVRSLAEPFVADRQCRLWDVEYAREGGSRILRLLIDRTDRSVSVEDCEAVSRAIDPILDREDPIPEPYMLEVSSAGLERSLKRPEHFEASIGKQVEVLLYAPLDGAKQFTGTLDAHDGDSVTITTQAGSRSFELKAVALVRWLFEF